MVIDRIPKGITRDDVLHALEDLDHNTQHKFADSTKYDVVYNGRRYPPKAVVGLAARRILGENLGPYDFSGGEGSRCFGVLRGLGFSIDLKDESLLQPTADRKELDRRTREVRRQHITEKPRGNQTPKKVEGSSTQYERDPAVRAWVLDYANGTCELCQTPGPFVTKEGDRFLEVHHVSPIAKGGPDVIENAVALCPNCHRQCHLSVDSQEQREYLYATVERLKKCK